jgi:hypothetical protein
MMESLTDDTKAAKAVEDALSDVSPAQALRALALVHQRKVTEQAELVAKEQKAQEERNQQMIKDAREEQERQIKEQRELAEENEKRQKAAAEEAEKAARAAHDEAAKKADKKGQPKGD